MTFDPSSMGGAFSRPGMDPRMWTSAGRVDADTPDARNVEFTEEYGPLVAVTLQPSGLPVRARVGSSHAGNGEGSWRPFMEGDEVQVVINEGDERNCIITHRLNQQIDKFPTRVAGSDMTQNSCAFDRMRTPYIFETERAYLVHNAATGSYFSMDATGAVQLVNGDKAFLALTPHLIGMQTGDASCLFQIDVEKKQINIEANGAKATFDAERSTFTSSGTFEFAGLGNAANGHAATVEGVCALLQAFAVAAAAAATTPISLVSFFASLPVSLAGLISTASHLPLLPTVQTAITGALGAAQSPSLGIFGVGAPGTLVG